MAANTTDSRSTHTDALGTLGTIIDENEKRDAIHLGVEPVQAGMDLRPAQHVFIKDGKAYSTRPRGKVSGKFVGIVDPFLTRVVNEGQRFWLIVYPRQITSLRHVWEHPDFPDSRETGYDAPQPTEEQLHKMNVFIGEERACALQRIRDYAASLSREVYSDADYGYYGDGTITAEDLIETAMANLSNERGWGEYLSKGGLLDGISTSPQFWEDLAIYKGIQIPSDKRSNFFSCAC